MNKFYITTTLPYVNSDPHLGFAQEIIEADIMARYQRLIGNEVIFNTGTDEHGLKIHRKAEEQGKSTQDYVDEYAAKFDNLKQSLNLSYTNFIRTTDADHKAAAQEFWKLCLANDDIYKKNYEVKYCVGCELEKTDSELVDDKCPIHPNLEIEIIEEENYFFRWSKYQQPLLDLYKSQPDFVLPDYRLKEISQFVEEGLNDFSISRLKSKMPWGVPVPGDEEQVMYVWFDALVNYISTLGWPNNKDNFENFWPGVQIAGKDNLRQQSAMWQAMLLSAKLPTSKQIIIHGFITSNGQKMSKSLGNVVDPYEVVSKYGTDALRYWISKEASTFEDNDFTWDRFNENYTAGLANGIGNLVARTAKMCEKNQITLAENELSFLPEVSQNIEKWLFSEASNIIWDLIAKADKQISDTKPWELEGEAAVSALTDLANQIRIIAYNLQPFLPQTAEKILKQFSGQIKASDPLFPRI